VTQELSPTDTTNSCFKEFLTGVEIFHKLHGILFGLVYPMIAYTLKFWIPCLDTDIILHLRFFLGFLLVVCFLTNLFNCSAFNLLSCALTYFINFSLHSVLVTLSPITRFILLKPILNIISISESLFMVGWIGIS